MRIRPSPTSSQREAAFHELLSRTDTTGPHLEQLPEMADSWSPTDAQFLRGVHA
jgi:hypothetical protein